jgi:SpoU rRNA methylase family enzyme
MAEDTAAADERRTQHEANIAEIRKGLVAGALATSRRFAEAAQSGSPADALALAQATHESLRMLREIA